jgi:hypothetical protein
MVRKLNWPTEYMNQTRNKTSVYGQRRTRSSNALELAISLGRRRPELLSVVWPAGRDDIVRRMEQPRGGNDARDEQVRALTIKD